LVHRCDWSADDQSLTLHPEIAEEFSESLLKIVSEKDNESYFYLLVSNSVIVPETVLPLYSETEHWFFRKLGISVLQNDEAENLIRNVCGLQQHIIMPTEQNLTVNMGNTKAGVTLEEKRVYWDIIYVLKIIETSGDR
jgi:hypothetical protein